MCAHLGTGMLQVCTCTTGCLKVCPATILPFVCVLQVLVCCTGACSCVRMGTPYCLPFIAHYTLRSSVCCSVSVVITYALWYRRGAGMYLHGELLEAWSGGHFTFYF